VLRTGLRIRRTLASASSAITPALAATAWTRARVCGRHSSTILSLIQLANASFSHRSFHHTIVTRSPNHWWASSWEIRPSRSPSASAPGARIAVSYMVVAEVFSIPPAPKFQTMTWA